MIVMKFGGTSVEDATAIRRLISIVSAELHRRPIVTVSAMGKTTNDLLECARLAADGAIEDSLSKLNSIASHHLQTADQLALPQEKAELNKTLTKRLEEI